MFDNIKSYADFANQLGGTVLCNAMAERDIELISGRIKGNGQIYQWYIVENPSFAIDHTNELIFYEDERNLNILAV